jgi:superfamily II DNA or RNA helicase
VTRTFEDPRRPAVVHLRHYQADAIARVDDAVANGVRRVLLVAATGSGKTTIAGFMILRAIERGERVVFLAHRRELILQAYRRLLDLGLTSDQVGVIMGNDPRRRPGAHVQVASVDTLRRRARPAADVVFYDEAHRSLSATQRALAAGWPDALHIGLTATPYGPDGAGMGAAYDELVVVASPRQLIAEGFLVEPRVFTVPALQRPDLKGVRVARGDYAQAELEAALDRQALVGNIVEHWKRLADGVRTVVFAVSIAHSKHITERFIEAGVAAEHLDGETPTAERDAVLARLDLGDTRVVSGVGVLAEGWDQPSVKCAILARPTKSTGLYLQQAGRILRPWNDEPAIILDHAGCALEHGLPQDDRVFTLEGKKKRGGVSLEAPTRVCPDCAAVVAVTTRVCPECGKQLLATREAPVEAPGDLVETSADDVRRHAFDMLCAEATARGFKTGWAFHRYRDQYGVAPPIHWKPRPVAFDATTLPPPRNARWLEALRDAARAGPRTVAWSAIDARADEASP